MARAVDPEGDPPSFAGRPGRGPLRGDTLALMIDAVQDYAIFMLSPDGTIMTRNTGAKRIKGYADDELVGQNFSILYPEEDDRAGKPQGEPADPTTKGRVG